MNFFVLHLPLHLAMGTDHRHSSIARFGLRKKPKPASVSTITDVKAPLPPPSDVPRVLLPPVETQLNMHQYNGLFEASSSERQNGSGETAGELFLCLAPLFPIYGEADRISCAAQSSPDPPNGDALSTEWSSAVGHATTGKSGRVIHTLQEDIARLTRECSLYRSRAEETQRMNEAFKTQVQNMAERLRNLELANETNLHSISRKDRKIEELRSEAQSERNRRNRAESETNKTNQLMVEARDDFNRKCAELQEITNYSRTQYDVLVSSRQREQAEQLRKIKSIRDEFAALQQEHENRNAQLERLDTVMAQKNREIEVNKENFEKLFEDYEAYKNMRDLEVRQLIENGHKNEASIDRSLASLKKTEGEMKWAIRMNELEGAE